MTTRQRRAALSILADNGGRLLAPEPLGTRRSTWETLVAGGYVREVWVDGGRRRTPGGRSRVVEVLDHYEITDEGRRIVEAMTEGERFAARVARRTGVQSTRFVRWRHRTKGYVVAREHDGSGRTA